MPLTIMTIPAWQVTANEQKKELETKLVRESVQLPSVGPDVKDVTSIDLSKSLSPTELRITALKPEILLAKLSRGELTSLEVTVRCGVCDRMPLTPRMRSSAGR